MFLVIALLLLTIANLPHLLFPKTRTGRSYYIAKAMDGSNRYPMGKMIWLNPERAEQEGDQLSVFGRFELIRVDPDGHERHLKTLNGWVNLNLTAKGKPALDQEIMTLATSSPLGRLEFATSGGELYYLCLLYTSDAADE